MQRMTGAGGPGDDIAVDLHRQAAAVKWCEETDTDSMEVVVLLDQDDEFVTALSLKPAGNSEVLLRKKLDTLRRSLA